MAACRTAFPYVRTGLIAGMGRKLPFPVVAGMGGKLPFRRLRSSPMKAAFALIAAMVLTGCSDACSNTAHKTVTSPDGTVRAVLFDRDCGATTGFTTQVSIADGDKTPSGKGNVFIADGGSKPAKWGGPWADVSWVKPKHLLVRYDATARVFAQNKTVGDTEISYQPMRH